MEWGLFASLNRVGGSMCGFSQNGVHLFLSFYGGFQMCRAIRWIMGKAVLQACGGRRRSRGRGRSEGMLARHIGPAGSGWSSSSLIE